MNILITGGTGFLGKECINSYSTKHHIFATYRTNPGEEQNNVDWIKLDLTKEKEFTAAYDQLKNENIDLILHAGGATPNRAYADGNFYATTIGTKHLLNLATELEIKKLIFISSNCVTFKFKGEYANSKLTAEKDVKNYNLNYTIIRPETIIGKTAKDFNRVAKYVQSHRLFTLIGPGNNYSQPIDVNDLVGIIEFCFNNINTNKKTYFAVGKDSLTTKQLLKKISSLKNRKLTILPIPKFLVLIIAFIVNKINPRLGLNKERVEIMSYSRKYDSSEMDYYPENLKSIDEMINYLK
jgi:UDP-glucose 4-epimerase